MERQKYGILPLFIGTFTIADAFVDGPSELLDENGERLDAELIGNLLKSPSKLPYVDMVIVDNLDNEIYVRGILSYNNGELSLCWYSSGNDEVCAITIDSSLSFTYTHGALS